MIRAVLTKRNGTKVLILGIDRENVRRLMAGDASLYVQGETVDLPGLQGYTKTPQTEH